MFRNYISESTCQYFRQHIRTDHLLSTENHDLGQRKFSSSCNVGYPANSIKQLKNCLKLQSIQKSVFVLLFLFAQLISQAKQGTFIVIPMPLLFPASFINSPECRVHQELGIRHLGSCGRRAASEWLGTKAALTKSQSLVPNTHLGQFTITVIPDLGPNALYWPPRPPALMCTNTPLKIIKLNL